MFATLAGGYPWAPGLSPVQALDAVIEAQADAGLGLLSDGRLHPPSEPHDELIAAWVAARDTAARLAPALPVKVAIQGPFAAGGPEGALETSRALQPVLLALADAGCPVIEIHEPAPTLPADEAGRAAFEAAHGALLDRIPGSLHASLAITGGDAARLGAESVFAAPYRSHLFDLLAGPDSWRLVAVAPKERGIILGVGDASGLGRTRLEDVVWAAGYAASTQGRGMERIGVAPSAGLDGLATEDARAILDLLGEAARAITAGSDELVARLDPRAIDARTAALGRQAPAPRRRPSGR